MAAQPKPKLGRLPSIRDRVEDTLSAHRNELISLLSRFLLCQTYFFLVN